MSSFSFGNLPPASEQKFGYNSIMEKMIEKEIQEAVENLKLERVNSYGASGRIIFEWKLKTSLNGVMVDLSDANIFIKTSHWEHLSEEEKEFAS